MLEKGKISAFQMAIMMYPTIVGTGIIYVPGITAKYAKNDMWLSPIWASFIGLLVVYTVLQLHNMYPRQTIVQYSEHIMGRMLGKIIGFIYLSFYINMNGEGVRIYADFVVGSFFPHTHATLAPIRLSESEKINLAFVIFLSLFISTQ